MRVLEPQKITGLVNPNPSVLTPRVEPVTEDDGRYFNRTHVAKLIGVRSRNTVWQYHKILLSYAWYARYSMRPDWQGKQTVDPRSPISREQLQVLKVVAKSAKSTRRLERVKQFIKDNSSELRNLAK